MSLHQAKQDLATALRATGIRVTTFVPEGLTPPLIVMQGSDPYIEDLDDTFNRNEMLVNLTLTYVSGKIGSNGVEDIDKWIDRLIPVIPKEFSVSVGPPYAGSVNGKIYPSCDISVSNIYRL